MRRRDGVIAWRLEDDPERVEERALEGEVVRHLDNAGVREKRVTKIRPHLGNVRDVPALAMVEGRVDRGALAHRKAQADHKRLVRVERGFGFFPVLQERGRFEVESDDPRAVEIAPDFVYRVNGLVVHEILHHGGGRESPPPKACYQASGATSGSASTSTASSAV